MFRSHASGNKKQWSKRSSNGNTPAASASGSHAYRQQTLSSFFMGSGKKSAAASKNSTTIIDLESGDEGNRNITAPPRPRLIRNNSSSLFSQSQGSFGDDDPDAEFKKLVDVPRLNSYKKSSRSLSMTSSLHKTASASTTQKTYHFDEDETLREVTSVKSNSRQLSFTSTINIEDSSMKLSTDSERPAKRSKPSMEFQGLKLTVPKKIKPLLRKTVSNMDSMNHRSASSPVVLTMEQERVVNLIVKKRTNVFYTGSAGTGKSVILQTIIRQLSSLYGKESIAITASTGLAAVTIGGSTLHKQQDNKLIDILNAIRYGELTVDIAKTIRNLNRDIDYADGIAPTELYATRREVELSNVKKLQSLPGDLYEFKAVDNAPERYQAILDSSLMVEKVVALKEDAQVMMLKNKPDVELVNGSLGKVLFFVTESLVVKMKEIYKIVDDEVVMDMRLVSRVIGNPLLKESKEFRQDLNARPLARLERLKILINYAVKISPHKEKFPYVRWTVGKNKYIHELMVPERFPIDIPRENVGLERTQIPLMLCWALSIHKAQGQTIQRLKVDLRRIFEAGQVYVALSRAVTMDTLQVLNFDPGKIRTNERVKDFYKRLETLK
ncbi:CFF_collapsed_G0024140.mRNA.1.CDS.1 [Saccharomyces cerevisiae]|nr:ATP-dependent DNA helicase RRM3 [Saccharomyces cerevisiae]CAI7332588.1 CFF_collapsed_G0024140.mRNA.1.CDS.1 [Saccharomyces cerevisiae]